MTRRLFAPAVVLLLLGAGSAGAGTPALSIDSVRTAETNFDTVAVLTATLASPSANPVTVQYATADGTADATDYVPTSGTLTFAPGQTQARIPVLIKGDALDEADETFFVDVDGARGTVTIVDDLRDRVPVHVLEAAIDARWNVQRRFTRVARLVVARAPATASIDVGCAGKGCPFRFKTATRALTGLFAGAKLRPGTVIQITVDAPGQIGKRFRYGVRAGKAPVRTVAALD
jgi:Calx-beta domain